MFTTMKIPGYVARGYRDERDLEAIVKLLNANLAFDRVQDMESLDALRLRFLDLPSFDIARDLVLIDDADGQLAAYARTFARDEPGGRRQHLLSINVRARDRNRGLGRALLAWVEARCADKERANPASEAGIDTWVETDLGGAFALRHGFQHIRTGIEMARDLSEPLAEPVFPAGFELRPVMPDHYRPIFDADINAFRDHFGFTEPDEKEYDRFLAGPQFQPALWKVLWHRDSDTIAAQVLNYQDDEFNTTFGVKRGYTEDITTQRQFRRMGLARNLILASLRMFKDMGMTEAVLGADADNLTGAVRVYESCGFRVTKSFAMYRKPVEIR
jgi:ribosomal protein S18 acetylase RimI-like enzyme